MNELLNLLSLSPDVLNDALELRNNRNVDIVEKLDPEVALQVSDKMTSQINLAKQLSGTEQDDFILRNTFYRCLKLVDHSVRQYPE
ncbi:hypothetical protein H6768_03310 [Candidatus Peribacteria bacterium]|nr:hypothetical protein [Candidatus Peribacteria bacterium]